MRDFFSFSSDSVAAPTFMTATPPESLARRSLHLLAIEVGIDALKLCANLIAAISDSLLVASAVDDDGGVLGDLDGLGGAEHVERSLAENQAEVLSDNLAVGDDSDVLEDALAAVAEARSLDGGAGEGATQTVQKNGGESLALDVLGNDEQRTTVLADGLENAGGYPGWR